MNKYDVCTYISIVSIVGIVYLLATINSLTIEAGITMLGILFGLVTYFMSIQSGRKTMLIMMVMFDDKRRKILEYLEEPRLFDGVADWVEKHNVSRGELTTLITSLKERGFIKEKDSDEGKRYKRVF